jgi:hypothetical protein
VRLRDVDALECRWCFPDAVVEPSGRPSALTTASTRSSDSPRNPQEYFRYTVNRRMAQETAFDVGYCGWWRLVELTVLHTFDEGVPFSWSEDERWAGGVLAVADASASAGQFGDFNAVAAVGSRLAGLAPSGCLEFSSQFVHRCSVSLIRARDLRWDSASD